MYQILTPKQMLQRLPIDLTHIKAGNNSKTLVNKIRQIFYSLYQSVGLYGLFWPTNGRTFAIFNTLKKY